MSFLKMQHMHFTTCIVITCIPCFVVLHSYGNFADATNIKDNSSCVIKETENSDRSHSSRYYMGQNYAVDSSKQRRLALVEENLTIALSGLSRILLYRSPSPLNKSDLCSDKLEIYLSDFERDTKAVKGQVGSGRANLVAENPNLVLRLIRRLFVMLGNAVNACKETYPDVEYVVNAAFQEANLGPPTKQDFDEALMGLLRIQYFYGLNATSGVRFGDFLGVKTEAKLYFEDCLALARKAIVIKAEALAYQWLISATLNLLEFNSPLESGIDLQRNKERFQDLEEAWGKLRNLTSSGSLQELHERLGHQMQSKFGYYDYFHYANCRGINMLTNEEQSKLFCFNNDKIHSYFYINPVKTEILSLKPVILQFYDFVDDQTISFIKQATRNGMQRSLAGSYRYNSEVDRFAIRTSLTGWLNTTHEHNPDPKIVKLNKRIEKLIGLEVHRKGANEMQVVSYGSLGGHFDYHHDATQNGLIDQEFDGDRLATFLMFLSDVKLGGYTAFQKAGVYAKPTKGSAILWYNLFKNGSMDLSRSHGGCPVILGSKEISNIWIKQYENMWKYPCSLDQEI